MFLVFFFQAEDGIRDTSVTGVQTCALPICQIPQQAQGFQFRGLQFAERRDYVIDCNWKVYVDNYLEGYHIPIAHPGLMKRSEERRVGNECRSRSAQEAKRKKEAEKCGKRRQ